MTGLPGLWRASRSRYITFSPERWKSSERDCARTNPVRRLLILVHFAPRSYTVSRNRRQMVARRCSLRNTRGEIITQPLHSWNIDLSFSQTFNKLLGIPKTDAHTEDYIKELFFDRFKGAFDKILINLARVIEKSVYQSQIESMNISLQLWGHAIWSPLIGCIAQGRRNIAGV